MILNCNSTMATIEDLPSNLKTEEFDISEPSLIGNMGRSESGKRIFSLVYFIKEDKA